MAERNAGRTRTRILEIALELFNAQGYAGTSIADIAGRLGTSKAALYYHFTSKQDILDALLAEPLHAHTRVAELATGEHAEPEQLLAALIDLVADGSEILGMVSNDPSVLAVLTEREREYGLRAKDERIVAALTGAEPDTAATIRAHAAIAVAKHGTKAAMEAITGPLDAAGRKEILGAALRALAPETTPGWAR